MVKKKPFTNFVKGSILFEILYRQLLTKHNATLHTLEKHTATHTHDAIGK